MNFPGHNAGQGRAAIVFCSAPDFYCRAMGYMIAMAVNGSSVAFPGGMQNRGSIVNSFISGAGPFLPRGRWNRRH